jgi:hypothetical protein
VPRPSNTQLSWSALLIALAAFAVALSGGALGLPGKKVVDKNDLAKNVVNSKHVKNNKLGLADLSRNAERGLTDPRAHALVLGAPDIEVDERYSRGITDEDVFVNNSAFCIRGIGFRPRHVQVTPQVNPTNAVPIAILDDQAACQGGTAVSFGTLMYAEDFFVALYE